MQSMTFNRSLKAVFLEGDDGNPTIKAIEGNGNTAPPFLDAETHTKDNLQTRSCDTGEVLVDGLT